VFIRRVQQFLESVAAAASIDDSLTVQHV
jgi:hypothetical protein